VHYTTTSTETYHENGETKTRTVTHHHTAHDHEHNCKIRVPVAKFPDGWVAEAPPAYDGSGNYYQFPFEFSLPQTVPAGTVIHNGRDRAAIVHTVLVEVRHGEHHHHCKSYEVYHTGVNVLSRNFQPVSAQFTRDTKDVMFCCCFPRGTVELGAKLDKNAYRAGDNLTFQAYATNNSTVKQEDCRPMMAVVEHNRFSACGHHSHGSCDLIRQYIDVPSSEADLHETVFRFSLPHSARSTTLGENAKLVSIWHEADFIVNTPCCSGNPTVCLPIVITQEPPHKEIFAAVGESVQDPSAAPQYSMPVNYTPVEAAYPPQYASLPPPPPYNPYAGDPTALPPPPLPPSNAPLDYGQTSNDPRERLLNPA